MRTLTVSLIKRRSIFLVLVAILACDSFEEDSIKPEKQVIFSEVEFYTIPASSIIIDLNSVIKQSFISTSLTISQNPAKGSLTKLDASILKYTPNENFTEGSDHFVFSAVLSDGSTLKGGAIPIYMKNSVAEFPCGVYPLEDKIRMNSAGGTAVGVLDNDHICDATGSMNVFIHQAPKFGEAIAVGDSIIYTPSSSFSTGDELVYGLTTSGSDDISFGLVSFNNKQFEALNVPLGSNQIFFIDDTIGFIGAGDVIYKTIDGGMRWNALKFQDENDLFSIGEIYFLDKDLGFAALSKCEWWGSYCSGAWMMTTNGGLTWKRFNTDHQVRSIFFTSPEVGFISITTNNDGPDLVADHIIYKTIDGGDTWSEVYRREDSSSGLSIRFANDLVGYAYDPAAIYKTTDGGQSWEPSINKDVISSFAIASDDVACASFSSVISNVAGASTPSDIVRSEKGFTWTPVTNLPYTILTQGFSPEGELGLAGGVSAYGPDEFFMTISKSTDKGKTWVELIKRVEGYPLQISLPSLNVAYILCRDKLIKYSPE
jgi:hypothetical protein